MDFLTCGFAYVQLTSPVYDEEAFEVQIQAFDSSGYEPLLVCSDGTIAANAKVEVPAGSGMPPRRRGDPLGDEHASLAPATRETMQALKDDGCYAFADRWSEQHVMSTYLRDKSAMATLYREGCANPSFIGGLCNWALAPTCT